VTLRWVMISAGTSARKEWSKEITWAMSASARLFAARAVRPSHIGATSWITPYTASIISSGRSSKESAARSHQPWATRCSCIAVRTAPHASR